MPAGGSRQPASHETVDQRLHYVKQEGQTVFKFAVTKTGDVCERLLQRNHLTASDIDLFVSHQANRRIIMSAAERLGPAGGEGRHQHRALRQHHGRHHPAGAQRRGQGRPAEEGRPRAARVGRRRVHRRRRADALGHLKADRLHACSTPRSHGCHEAPRPDSPLRPRTPSRAETAHRNRATPAISYLNS